MIINFSELTIPFHRLAAGAVLISPDDERYLKHVSVSVSSMCGLWSSATDLSLYVSTSDITMKAIVGDGEGWKVLP